MTKLAAIQMRSTPLDIQGNVASVLSHMQAAAEAGVRLAVFPECILTGYMLNADQVAVAAQRSDGEAARTLAQACARHSLWIAIGTIERTPQGGLANAAWLMGPDGLQASYHKTHLPFLGVDRYLPPGETLQPPVDLGYGRFGLLICYDLRLPEPSRCLALEGAQAILLPTAWPDSASFYPDFMAQTRAAENGIALVAANRVGSEAGNRYLGHSMIIGQDGEKLAEADGESESMLTADIDLARSSEKRRIFSPDEYELDLFGDRRPELYQRLTLR
jgi:predicted amidohydrolase